VGSRRCRSALLSVGALAAWCRVVALAEALAAGAVRCCDWEEGADRVRLGVDREGVDKD
jgi:hypothetical protein